MNKIQSGILLMSLFISTRSVAGPPYDTDDPEPVDFQHWEFYCSSIGSKAVDAWMGTAPHIEINYGVIPNMQLHVIAPLSFYSSWEDFNYGYGMTELGVKYRFINIDSSNFQIGVFPLIEIPTQSLDDLGNKKAQFFIPLWIQKNIGKWSTYGGGGYWINPGAGNRNYMFVGWQEQYQVLKKINIGTELCYASASQVGGDGDFRFRLGSVIDFNDHNHLLISCGRSIAGDTSLQWYLGYQLTI